MRIEGTQYAPDPSCQHEWLADRLPPYHGPAVPGGLQSDGSIDIVLRIREWECVACGGFVNCMWGLYDVDGKVAKKKQPPARRLSMKERRELRQRQTQGAA